MSSKHIADAEAKFVVVNVNPDFCRVNGQVVPFDIFQRLPPEKAGYCATVHAHGVKVLNLDSVVEGVIGNAGQGILSTVSGGSGHTAPIEGETTVVANGAPVVRHDHLVLMNVKA